MLSLFVLHAAATLFMTGLIWFVQVVHYPLAGQVGEAAFMNYQRQHMRRTTWVVGPVMLVEAFTAASLVLLAEGPNLQLALMGLVLLGATWASTVFLQVPSHSKLERYGHDPDEVAKLVRGNWVRTVCWSARSVVALAMLGTAGAP